jgi:hypothetical protein
MQVIGYVGNPVPFAPIEHPLDDVDWDSSPVNFCDYDTYKKYVNKYDNPFQYFRVHSSKFFILPSRPNVIQHSNHYIDDVNLDDYDDDVTWEEIVKDVKNLAYKNFDDHMEWLRETRGGSLNL